jgi:hypothetical protein
MVRAEGLGSEADDHLSSLGSVDSGPEITMPFDEGLDLGKQDPQVALVQLRVELLDILQLIPGLYRAQPSQDSIQVCLSQGAQVPDPKRHHFRLIVDLKHALDVKGFAGAQDQLEHEGWDRLAFGPIEVLANRQTHEPTLVSLFHLELPLESVKATLPRQMPPGRRLTNRTRCLPTTIRRQQAITYEGVPRRRLKVSGGLSAKSLDHKPSAAPGHPECQSHPLDGTQPWHST